MSQTTKKTTSKTKKKTTHRGRVYSRSAPVSGEDKAPSAPAYKPQESFKTTVQRMGGDPVVTFSDEALEDIRHIVDLCSQEVGWMMSVYEGEGGNFYVHKVYLFKQTVKPTHTDSGSGGNLAEIAEELLMDGEFEESDHLRGWGHSHVNMKVFASGTDDSTMPKLFDTSPYGLRLICNKKGDFKVDIWDYQNGHIWKNVKWQPESTYSPPRRKEIAEEMKEKLSRATYGSSRVTGFWGSYGSYGGQGTNGRSGRRKTTKVRDGRKETTEKKEEKAPKKKEIARLPSASQEDIERLNSILERCTQINEAEEFDPQQLSGKGKNYLKQIGYELSEWEDAIHGALFLGNEEHQELIQAFTTESIGPVEYFDRARDIQQGSSTFSGFVPSEDPGKERVLIEEAAYAELTSGDWSGFDSDHADAIIANLDSLFEAFEGLKPAVAFGEKVKSFMRSQNYGLDQWGQLLYESTMLGRQAERCIMADLLSAEIDVAEAMKQLARIEEVRVDPPPAPSAQD